MITKTLQVLILICLFTSVNSFGQKSTNTSKNGEYELEATYEPDEKKAEAIANEATVTSIKLTSFEGKFIETESFIQLDWKVAKKTGDFTVEHSVDDEYYEALGTTDPIAFEDTRYSYEARVFEAGINFYRLKQEIGDKVIYSEVKAVSVSKKDDVHILKLKNEGDITKIQLRVREAQKVIIQLYDEEGKMIKELFNQPMDDNEIIFRSIVKDNFEAGTYFLLIKGDTFKQSKKIELP